MLRIEFDVILTVWVRELKRFFRARERTLTALALPFLLAILFATGLSSSIRFTGVSMDYTTFLIPGIVSMPLLFTSFNSAIMVISDRKFGFLKEMLVAPVSRISIVLGKALGGTTIATLQGILILILFFLLGDIELSLSFLIAIPLMILVSIGFVCLGIAVASKLETMESFSLIGNFIITPTYFLSGAFFPVGNLPQWLGVLSRLNPLTYGVEMFREIITGGSSVPLSFSLAFVAGFSTLTLIVGSYLFTRRQK